MTFPGVPSQQMPRGEDWIAKAIAELRRTLTRRAATLGQATNPPGAILAYGGSSAPTGYLLCNGAAVDRTIYAGLFAAIGTTYGVGDGSTTFNLPDFTSKFMRGNTPGTGAGVDTHSHSLSATGYAALTFTTSRIDAIKQNGTWTGNSAANWTGGSSGTTQAEVNGIALGGATDPQSHIPAYTGVNFLIKT